VCRRAGMAPIRASCCAKMHPYCTKSHILDMSIHMVLTKSISHTHTHTHSSMIDTALPADESCIAPAIAREFLLWYSSPRPNTPLCEHPCVHHLTVFEHTFANNNVKQKRTFGHTHKVPKYYHTALITNGAQAESNNCWI
jgi:hypothetical protein